MYIFSKPRPFRGKCKIEFDLSNYAAKTDLKNASGVDKSKFANKVDLTSLKSEIDKLDIGKLETTLVYLSKLNDVRKIKLLLKAVYDELVKKSSHYLNH